MQSTVTLELYEYNELYSKALYHDNLEIENKQLKEELAIAHKQLEELQQPKEDTPTYTIKISGKEIDEVVKEAAANFKKELEKETNKQNYMICNYLQDGIVFVAKHIIIANEKDMEIIKEKFDKIDWIEIEL